MTEQVKWWKNPQGIVATATVATMVLGFFYVREKQMWEATSHITALESRGENAIKRIDDKLGRIEEWLSTIRDQVNFLERKIDRLELKQAEDDEVKKNPYR